MILPDVNVLIYAFRVDADDHVRHRAWLNAVVNGPAIFAICPQVLAAVVRITTHPRIFRNPSSRAEAFAFCNAVMNSSCATVVVPGERHWGIFERLCDEARASGNLVQDAWFAALAIESGCEWITTDRDYARFSGLDWRTPP